MDNEKLSGVIVHYNVEKGFGHLWCEATEKRYWYHISEFQEYRKTRALPEIGAAVKFAHDPLKSGKHDTAVQVEKA
ncbi:MAG TPA: hypothetical protein VOA88_08465 [Candidatus Dormibacteraeota bacterium]|nr:hypothetical protein [Candidatus Dormibacteraeota bacterium]